MGSTTFKDNAAYWGGAIYNNGRDSEPTTTFPDDTVFVDNRAEVRATFQMAKLSLLKQKWRR